MKAESVHVPVTVRWPLEDLLSLKPMLWQAVEDFWGRWANARLACGLVVGVYRDSETGHHTVRLTAPLQVTPDQQHQARRLSDLWELHGWIRTKEVTATERHLIYREPTP